MVTKLSTKQRQQLIEDIVAAQNDPVTLGEGHNLGPDDLAQWVSDPLNQSTLSGLCVLADLQTQILLSRYRLLAAGRLIKLATEDDPDASRDVARRACVDLLKLDLKRADFDTAGFIKSNAAGANPELGGGNVAALRRLLYGDVDKPKKKVARRGDGVGD